MIRRPPRSTLFPTRRSSDLPFAEACVKRFMRDVSLGVCVAVLAERHVRSEGHTSEIQSPLNLVCRLLLEKKKHVCGFSAFDFCSRVCISCSWTLARHRHRRC